ncbi:hypothetical protein [Stenotrophomonas sp. PD6]|uniref:hypothetical protein n=1 Tax=Stenotrophomonas sp. PD6 TaxID=3368612 RepID=UPI003BA367AC
MRLLLMTGVLALGVSGIALGADCPQVDVRDTGRVESNGWGAARQFEVKNLGADRVGFLVWRGALVPWVYGHSADIEVEVNGRWRPYIISLDEYIPPHYTLWVKPGQSRRVAVGEPQWGSGFTGSRGDIDKGPFTLRLSDHRFKCTYRSEPFVPAEMDVRK